MLKQIKPLVLTLMLIFAFSAATAGAQTYNSNMDSGNNTSASSSDMNTTNTVDSDVGLPTTGSAGEAGRNLALMTSFLGLALTGWVISRKAI